MQYIYISIEGICEAKEKVIRQSVKYLHLPCDELTIACSASLSNLILLFYTSKTSKVVNDCARSCAKVCRTTGLRCQVSVGWSDLYCKLSQTARKTLQP